MLDSSVPVVLSDFSVFIVLLDSDGLIVLSDIDGLIVLLDIDSFIVSLDTDGLIVLLDTDGLIVLLDTDVFILLSDSDMTVLVVSYLLTAFSDTDVLTVLLYTDNLGILLFTGNRLILSSCAGCCFKDTRSSGWFRDDDWWRKTLLLGQPSTQWCKSAKLCPRHGDMNFSRKMASSAGTCSPPGTFAATKAPLHRTASWQHRGAVSSRFRLQETLSLGESAEVFVHCTSSWRSETTTASRQIPQKRRWLAIARSAPTTSGPPCTSFWQEQSTNSSGLLWKKRSSGVLIPTETCLSRWAGLLIESDLCGSGWRESTDSFGPRVWEWTTSGETMQPTEASLHWRQCSLSRRNGQIDATWRWLRKRHSLGELGTSAGVLLQCETASRKMETDSSQNVETDSSWNMETDSSKRVGTRNLETRDSSRHMETGSSRNETADCSVNVETGFSGNVDRDCSWKVNTGFSFMEPLDGCSEGGITTTLTQSEGFSRWRSSRLRENADNTGRCPCEVRGVGQVNTPTLVALTLTFWRQAIEVTEALTSRQTSEMASQWTTSSNT